MGSQRVMSLIRRLAKRVLRRGGRSQIALVRGSGLFDADWYLREYPEVKGSGAHPLAHFMELGWREGKSPGPGFETGWYLAQNPDVSRAGLNPLVHFLENGRREGRQPLPPKPLLEVLKLSDVEPAYVAEKSFRCAVVVHLHYADLSDEMLSACLNVPGQVQILVSATNQQAAEAAKAWGDRTGFDRIVVKMATNRGRNVAAFTTTFAKELLGCDLFCHIHSKKSLYSGAEMAGWRQSNLEHLLGSEEHVGRILNLFRKDPELGVVAPLPNPSMPYWAFTWLSNLRSGSELSRMLDVPFAFDGYFDYPLGCMFWARPSALKQLLDGRIKISDFPEEAGQTDGTLAHAVERSIYFVARSNGFGWIEIDRDHGSYKEGWSERNIHQYHAAKSFTSFKREVDASETICFDIFDTLITRIVPRPDDLFDMVESALDGDLGQKSEFHRHRKAAENALRVAKSSGDVSYDEIYAELARRKEAAGIAERACELEEAYELRATVARRQMVRGLNYALERGKRVILASDMYMRRPQVERLLTKSGVQGYHELYLSSETGLRKDDLSLWHHLIEKERAQNASFLHVGDNEHSDVQVPLGLGIRFYHVLSPRNLFDFTPLGYRMRRGQGAHRGKALSLGPTIASLCNDPFEGRA